jgi:starch synthase
MVASETVPLAKTGGLADVVGSLSGELTRLGHNIRLVLPCYKDFGDQIKDLVVAGTIQVPAMPVPLPVTVETGTINNVALILLRYDPFFARAGLYGEGGVDYPDNLARFALFCRGALEACRSLNWRPDLLHAHDWQAALAVVYLKTLYQSDGHWASCRALFTIHNMGYQGIFPATEYTMTGLPWSEYTPDRLEFFSQVNLLKGGIVYADLVNTVSPTYAREIQTPEFGYGLEGVLQTRKERVFGIINGIDYEQWSPQSDPYLPAHYSVKNLAGKKTCKSALQREMKLPARSVPLLAVVSRLVPQKGIDLILNILPNLLALDLQIVLLGTGDPVVEQRLTGLQDRFPKKFAVRLSFDEGLAHRIEAGADMFLMPSRYEPCGLNQLYSLSYGTVPIVRQTGGLADTVMPYLPDDKKGKGTGFVFELPHPEVLFAMILLGLQVCHDEEEWKRLMLRGMRQDFSWRHSAQEYVKLYEKALAVDQPAPAVPRDSFPRGHFRDLDLRLPFNP